MHKITKNIYELLARYAILVFVALPNLFLFYKLFTPLTVYPVYSVLRLFFESSLSSNIITVSGSYLIEISKSCVAGSAYYLLLILNLATPKIKLKKRLILIAVSFASLLVLNILRIILLTFILISGSQLFDITHKLFWYSLSVIFVVWIWFALVKFFKIKEIPFYSDLKFLVKLKK